MWHVILAETSTMDPLGLVGLIVGIAGMLFGWKQYIDMKAHRLAPRRQNSGRTNIQMCRAGRASWRC